MLLTTLLLLFFLRQIKSECEQRSFEHVQVQICASKCIVQTVTFCADGANFIGDVTDLRFINNKIPHFRRGIVKDLPHLKYLDASAFGIKKISPQAFYNTPKIENVDLQFNFIEEIPWGVFNNMTFEKITLSWNSISHIEEQAFSNMLNLKTILLTRNKLMTFDKEWFQNSVNLEVLNLSYNKLSKIFPFSFDAFPRLLYLDLSFNEILDLGGNLFLKGQSLERFDLTRNNLTAVTALVFPPEGVSVKELRVSLNKISFLSEKLLERGSVKSIALNPNPWQCPCLDKILDWIHKNNKTIMQPNDDHRINLNPELPVCAFKEKNPSECVLVYDEEFVDTQEKYFQSVYYPSALWEKPTSEPPNFDVLQIDTSFANFSQL